MEYNSDLNTVITNILGKISNTNLDSMNQEIATTLQASNIRRIHNEGKNTEEIRIGRYSLSPPLYINPKNSPVKFNPTGKGGKESMIKSSRLVFNIKSKKSVTQTKRDAQYFKNGKPHKTKYFNSYREFRKSIGYESSYVNLQLTKRLKNSFQIKKLSNGYAVGFWSSVYSRRAEHLEAKYGGTLIWGISKSDKLLADNIIQKYLNK